MYFRPILYSLTNTMINTIFLMCLLRRVAIEFAKNYFKGPSFGLLFKRLGKWPHCLAVCSLTERDTDNYLLTLLFPQYYYLAAYYALS